MTVLATTLHPGRLLGPEGAGGRPDLARHLATHGPLPAAELWGPNGRQWLLHEVQRSGLTGRGGAGFPTHLKLRTVYRDGAGYRDGARPTLIVNAMEGEPASAKDRALVGGAPHLVLDGADIVAAVLGASRILICVADDRRTMAAQLAEALAQRASGVPAQTAAHVDRTIVTLPGRYTAGEESALVASASGRPGVPAFRPDKSRPLTLGRRPVLVHNAETLANVALIARYGADWFRQLGAVEAPGTCLATVSGDVERAGVFEVETGTPISQIIGLAGELGTTQAVLVGGYGGSWLPAAGAATAYAPAALRRVGATMGAGVLVVLRAGACGLRETARIARFMAAESAGQCGPCLFGLPALADDLELLADGAASPDLWGRIVSRSALVTGRGACRHPDGVARLVSSALDVFAVDGHAHARGRPCPASHAPTVLQFSRPVDSGQGRR